MADIPRIFRPMPCLFPGTLLRRAQFLLGFHRLLIILREAFQKKPLKIAFRILFSHKRPDLPKLCILRPHLFHGKPRRKTSSKGILLFEMHQFMESGQIRYGSQNFTLTGCIALSSHIPFLHYVFVFFPVPGDQISFFIGKDPVNLLVAALPYFLHHTVLEQSFILRARIITQDP